MSENLGVKIDMTEQFSLIGKYVVSFEHIVEMIRFSLSVMFQIQGLKIWDMSKIVFSQRQFTAEPLIACFEHITFQVLRSEENSKDLIDQIDKFGKDFRKQINVRNDFLHGTYWLSDNFYVPNEDYILEDDFYVTKGAPSKKGADLKIVASKKEDIIKHLESLNNLSINIMELTRKVYIKFGEIAKRDQH